MKTSRTLVIEDNPADVTLLKIAFDRSQVETELIFRNDGEAGIEYLNEQAKLEGKSGLPNLIILDLNLPKKSGREVLEYIKNSKELKHIPVIILSTSDVTRDIEDCYEFHANSYLVKPNDFSVFQEMIDSLKDYWYLKNKQPDK